MSNTAHAAVPGGDTMIQQRRGRRWEWIDTQ
jgi:hypothetical protein